MPAPWCLLLACAAAGEVHAVPPGPDVRHQLQTALTLALPGDVVELAEGLYRLDRDLIVTTAGVTIRGAGPDRTRLSFRGQTSGSKGIEATGDGLVIEDLAIEDTRGTGLRITGARSVAVRRVRVEWTDGPRAENGAYGVYPVRCDSVLVEECVAIGASDAGIYVGQSRDVVVRRCRAERNVAGIEIENCVGADVHDNLARENTGGVLVVDLPGLDVVNGGRVRVFRNEIASNNHENFALPGNIVATVPPGSGLLVMATDRVEVFENRFRDHGTAHLSVLSYLVTGRPIDDPRYDPWPEGIHVHDNSFAGGGGRPAGALAALLRPFLGLPFPDVLHDGAVDERKLDGGRLPAELGLRLARNGGATFASVRFAAPPSQDGGAAGPRIDRDQAPCTGDLEPLPAVELAPRRPADPAAAVDVAFFRSAPPRLSEFGLFRGESAERRPAPGVLPYDLANELFADHAAKRRLIRLPEGGQIEYRASGVLEFPAGTVIVKTFSMPADLRDPSRGERLLETRILLRDDDGWHGLPYIWDEAGAEARLALGGGEVEVSWVHTGGGRRSNRYLVPSAAQCRSCHERDGAFVPLGPTARNLNQSFRHDGGEENQLARWTRLGALRDAPAPEEAPRMARLDDPASGTVEERARAWLDVNCAHCHSPLGPARQAGLDLRLEQDDPARYGVWKTPVAAGHGAGELEHVIVPGRPDESILAYRIASTEPGIMMPELPRRLVPEEGLAVVRDWIRGMDDPRR